MAKRTFGWIQNPSSIENLKRVVGIFVAKSKFYEELMSVKLPLLRSLDLFSSPSLYLDFVQILRSKKAIPYEMLKGKGAGGQARSTAKCSGLVQAVLDGQQFKNYVLNGEPIRIKKPYVDDWSADGFLRWAISLGFLNYNYEKDTCAITAIGERFVTARSKYVEDEILGKAFVSYPPICRVLRLLSEEKHMTKFEIGSQLGFMDEEGFTSFPQNIWVQAYMEADDDEKKRLRSDIEGSSDKYARMICGWLTTLGWVVKKPKDIVVSMGLKEYKCRISSAFEITDIGLQKYKELTGKESKARVPKIVYREMLASKAPNSDYLRMRRLLILIYLGDHTPRTIDDISLYLDSMGLEETTTTIKDDLIGLVGIGLDIQKEGEFYTLDDKIEKLVPYKDLLAKGNTDVIVVKERVRNKLHYINHKYLTLIDYAFSGKDKCVDFELYTMDLLVNELAFHGKHLGGSRRPDGLFYYGQNGIIVDNKTYSKGFTITRHMADEMIRYIQENNDRSYERNRSLWWNYFATDVNHFNYVFVSSLFKGKYGDMLNNIKQSTGIDGCVLTVENLLYYADAIKGNLISRKDFMQKFGVNTELVYSID